MKNFRKGGIMTRFWPLYKEDDPNGEYYAGDLKPAWAIALMTVIFLMAGYLEGLDQRL